MQIKRPFIERDMEGRKYVETLAKEVGLLNMETAVKPAGWPWKQFVKCVEKVLWSLNQSSGNNETSQVVFKKDLRPGYFVTKPIRQKRVAFLK